MNLKRQVEFTNSIKTLPLHTLKFLKNYLKDKHSEEDREDKIKLIEIQIETKKEQKYRLSKYDR